MKSKILSIAAGLLAAISVVAQESPGGGGIRTTNQPFLGAIIQVVSEAPLRFAYFQPTNLVGTASDRQQGDATLTNTTFALNVSGNSNKVAVFGNRAVTNASRRFYYETNVSHILSNLVAAAVSGDVIELGVGKFHLGNQNLKMPVGVTLIGQGIDRTIVSGTNALFSPGPGPLITISSTNKVADMTIDLAFSGTAFQAGIGFDYQAGHAAATNFVIERVRIPNGQTDAAYFAQSNFFSGVVRDCYFESKWDCFTITTPAAGARTNYIEVWNSTIKSDMFGATQSSAIGQAAKPARISNGILMLYDCHVIGTNGNDVTGLGATGTEPTAIFVIGGRVDVAGTNNVYQFDNSSSPGNQKVHVLGNAIVDAGGHPSAVLTVKSADFDILTANHINASSGNINTFTNGNQAYFLGGISQDTGFSATFGNVDAASMIAQDLTASTIVGADGTKKLFSITVGTGLAFDGTTLTATGGGGGGNSSFWTNGVAISNSGTNLDFIASASISFLATNANGKVTVQPNLVDADRGGVIVANSGTSLELDYTPAIMPNVSGLFQFGGSTNANWATNMSGNIGLLINFTNGTVGKLYWLEITSRGQPVVVSNSVNYVTHDGLPLSISTNGTTHLLVRLTTNVASGVAITNVTHFGPGFTIAFKNGSVAYTNTLTRHIDVVGGLSISTGGVFLATATNLMFRNGANTTVTGNVANATFDFAYNSTASGSGGGALVTNVVQFSGASTNIILDLGLASTNHVVFKVGMLTNAHVVLSNATSRKYPAEVVWQQDTNGQRSILSLRSTDGIIQTNGTLTITTNPSAMDKWFFSAAFFETNVVIQMGPPDLYTTSTNIFALNTKYTNGNFRAWVGASFELTAGIISTGKVALVIERPLVTNRLEVAALNGTNVFVISPLTGLVGPRDVYYFTNLSTGLGSSAAIVGNTCSIQEF